jgi:uncharacterized protein YndB with AHSA1/START domain
MTREHMVMSVTIAAPPPEVWRAIVDPQLAPSWMGMRLASTWELGSPVTVSGTPLGPRYREHGEVVAFEAGSLLAFSHWSKLWRIPDAPESRAILTIRVAAEGAGTRVSLEHDLPPVEAVAEHSAFFWRVGLRQLREMVEREPRAT